MLLIQTYPCCFLSTDCVSEHRQALTGLMCNKSGGSTGDCQECCPPSSPHTRSKDVFVKDGLLAKDGHYPVTRQNSGGNHCVQLTPTHPGSPCHGHSRSTLCGACNVVRATALAANGDSCKIEDPCHACKLLPLNLYGGRCATGAASGCLLRLTHRGSPHPNTCATFSSNTWSKSSHSSGSSSASASSASSATSSSSSASSSVPSSSVCSSADVDSSRPHALHRASSSSSGNSACSGGDNSSSQTGTGDHGHHHQTSLPSTSNSGGSTCSDSNAAAPTAATAKEVLVTCKWQECSVEVEARLLMDHIRSRHVDPQEGEERVVCLWEGCKVFNKPSCSRSWLERHIVTHSGDKPFRCIVSGCGAGFSTQAGLERHVNGHFNMLPPQPNKASKAGTDTPTKLNRKRSKLKRRRPQTVKTGDFFDCGVMEQLRSELQDMTQQSQLDINSAAHSVTFHGTVIARRTNDSGKVRALMRWTPEDVLPDAWVQESQVESLRRCVIPIHQLPPDTATNLHPSVYRQHRFRKHRRK